MFRRGIWLMLLAILGFLPGAGRSQPTKTASGVRTDRLALLVGVTFYESLPKAKHLNGPGNDVLLMRKLLLDKFQFNSEQIVVLSEDEGTARGKEYYPTRANIEREFKRLARVVQPGDQVVIHMGGHGSQQPEDKNSPDPEPDGLDEIFLPRDVKAWDRGKGTVANAIIDDEVGAWLKAIRDRKASVWITFDSCHSGTMIRGSDDTEVTRDLDPTKDLGIPAQDIKEAIDFAAKRDAKNPERSRGGDMPAPFKLAQEGGIVAIYACQPNEVTYERAMPPMAKEGKTYGLLTFTMCRILTEMTEKSKEPITYNELIRRIHGQYVQWGRSNPTPLIEGVDRDRQILGDKVWPGRSSILLEKGDDGFRITGGALHGLTPGSIFAVMPPPGAGDKLVGHVRIKDLGMYTAEVEPCPHGKAPVVKELPEGGVCKLVFVDMGDQQLQVAVDPRDSDDKSVPEAKRTELEKIVRALAGPQSLIKPIDKVSQADWLVRVQRDQVILVPATGWSVARAPIGDAQFGPAPIDGKLGEWLEDALNRIARAESLKRLAAGGDPAGGEEGIRLELKMTRKKNTADKLGSIPISWPTADVSVFNADRLVIQVMNKSRFPVDVTLLYVDSAYGIGCWFPRGGADNRLRPGEKITPPVSPKFNNKTSGKEHLIVIAVKGKGPPIDFSQLVQPTLERALEKAGTRGDDLRQSLETPLGKLLQRGMYGQSGTRGSTPEEMEDYGFLVVPFHVMSKNRPASDAK